MTHLVFVYGSLLSGLSNHRLLTDHGARFVGDGRTAAARYAMLSLGAYPGVVLNGDDAIVGEVYEVDDLGFAALDRLEGHPTFYRRQKHDVTLDDGRAVRAWIYLLPRHYTETHEQVDPDWRAVYTAALNRCEICDESDGVVNVAGYWLCNACADAMEACGS